MFSASVLPVQAATTSPQQLVYNGHLLGSNGEPMNSEFTIRFSIWNTSDYVSSDSTGGAIQTSAAAYLDWQEEHTITPDENGYFSLNLGAIAPLFNIATLETADLQNIFLQIEVKNSTDPNTAYELLDVNPSDSSVDRTPVLSVPFALNADYLDQREIGTGSGDIALLTDGGVFSPSVIPEQTFGDVFILDSDDSSSGSIVLQFGESLNKTLSYDKINSYFTFNDDVHIQGDLFVTGLINGVDITTLANSASSQLLVSSGSGLNVSITGGSYRINDTSYDYGGAGSIGLVDNAINYIFFTNVGLQINQTGFLTNQSVIRLAKVTTNAGAVIKVEDSREFLSNDGEEIVQNVYKPMYPNSSYTKSGSENTGALKLDFDTTNNKNFYNWKSSKSQLNSYTVVTEIALPLNFVSFDTSAFELEYRTVSPNTADNYLEITVLDTADAVVTLAGTTTNLANTNWSSTVVGINGAPTLTPGETIKVFITVHAKNNSEAHLGALKIRYKTL